MIMKLWSILFVVVLLNFLSASGQLLKNSSGEALQFFKNGDYEEALPLFKQLYENYSRDPKYNFYYGACLVETNTNISLAAQCLKFAQIKKFSKDVDFYLGRSYQLLYEFDIAIENFQNYLKSAKISGGYNDLAEKYIKQCETGKTLATKIYDLKVLRADTCLSDELLNYYDPVSDIGQVMKNNDFFESGIDPEGIMFLTERGDIAFYSLKNQAAQDWDLYKIEKLIDGWGEGTLLGGDVNSRYNELYPVLHTDGVTLYFSSDRPGGLGGYDIYKATYDSQKKRFSDVTNLGIPFNSPKDDYFFVCDDFSHLAWFTSNRNISGKKQVVYAIRWDDSVIRNFASDNNEVKAAARLALSKEDISKQVQAKDISTIENKKRKDNNDVLFHFSVTDTLEYTRFEHFKSDYALTTFKKGLELQNKRDSLEQRMKEKRRLYAVTEDERTRNQLVSEILNLEKQTYSLDNDIDNYYYQAQKSEQDKIKDLVRQGKYYSSSEVKTTPKANFSLNDVKFPVNLTLYSDNDYGRYLKDLKGMYQRLFVEPEISKLIYSDSLYAWGNILNIESSRLLEQAAHQEPQVQLKMPVPFKSDRSDEMEETQESLVKQARKLKLDALKLYHQSLDNKYQIYRNKFRDIRESQPKGDAYEQTMSYAGEAMTYYKAGDEMMNQSLVGIDLETYEKAGTYKRNAVLSQEKGMLFYLDIIDGKSVETSIAEVQKESEEVFPPSTAVQNEVEDADTLVDKEIKPVGLPKDIVANALKPAEEPKSILIYKIQIGVFRNQPDHEMLDKLSEISSDKIPDSGLMKYYSGNYTTYVDAVSHVSEVRNIGFDGAFVVAFKDGKQIAVSKARELEKID